MTENVNVTQAAPLKAPLLPIRDLVVFPHTVLPLFIGRPLTIRSVRTAMNGDRRIALVTQKESGRDAPELKDLYKTGTLARVLQMLKLPDGTLKVLVEADERIDIEAVETDSKEGYRAVYKPHPCVVQGTNNEEASRRAVLQRFLEYAQESKKLPEEVLQPIRESSSAMALADAVASQLPVDNERKQKILDQTTLQGCLNEILAILDNEMDILAVERRIHGRVKKQMEKNQRNYYLNEQMKAIRRELGDEENAGENDDISALRDKIKAAGMPAKTEEKALEELNKLKQMSPSNAEATVVRGYLDTLISLPWRAKTEVNKDLKKAEEILNADHWGLEKVKERILEYLAVQRRVDKIKSPILCLVGAPGVGKTSLGESIARATGRKYVRVALGGVQDSSDIRGHRRTYIGSMPGKIIQAMIKVGVKNPLFLLDEIDKIGSGVRGDPSAALLEVLDPEQNREFEDHYVDVGFDLSDVMFVATSNSYNIDPPLLDRMETIDLAGYTEDEKVHIAMEHLLPKQMRLNGLKKQEAEITQDAVVDIIRYYTREAGVRGLERSISKILRKIVREQCEREDALAQKQARAQKAAAEEGSQTASEAGQESGKAAKPRVRKVRVTPKNLSTYLGVRKFSFGVAPTEARVGQVNGLAWTSVGGDTLAVEAVCFPGRGNVIRTGSLGDVMKESVQAALSVVRARAQKLGIDPERFAKTDWHIHFPEGAVPKDGPSAGAAITTALASAITGIAVRSDIAMTGEITLRGEVLEIGGLKEKLLAAVRGGIKKVLIPEQNVKDLEEVPDNVKQAVEIVPVRWIDKVLDEALVSKPVPLEPKQEDPAVTAPVLPADDAAEPAAASGHCNC